MLAHYEGVRIATVMHIQCLPEWWQVIAAHVDDRTLRGLDPANQIQIKGHLGIDSDMQA